MNRPEFQRYMDESGGHSVLTPDEMRYVDVGQDYCRMTGADRADLIGRTVPEVFPPDKHGGLDAILASFERVKETHAADKMGVIRYDVAGRERWWRVDNLPVIHDGRVEYIVNRIEDVTLEIRNSRAIVAQRRSNYLLYGVVVLLIAGLAYVFSTSQKRTDRVGNENRVLLNRLHADEVRQLRNRAANVGTWCGAINNDRMVLVAYVDFFRRGRPSLPRLVLPLLPCTTLEHKTVVSGSPGGVR